MYFYLLLLSHMKWIFVLTASKTVAQAEIPDVFCGFHAVKMLKYVENLLWWCSLFIQFYVFILTSCTLLKIGIEIFK